MFKPYDGPCYRCPSPSRPRPCPRAPRPACGCCPASSARSRPSRPSRSSPTSVTACRAACWPTTCLEQSFRTFKVELGPELPGVPLPPEQIVTRRVRRAVHAPSRRPGERRHRRPAKGPCPRLLPRRAGTACARGRAIHQPRRSCVSVRGTGRRLWERPAEPQLTVAVVVAVVLRLAGDLRHRSDLERALRPRST